MTGFSNYTASKIIDFVFGNVAYTPPATIYVALAKGSVVDSDTGTTFAEANYTGYSRVAVTNNATTFPNATNGSKTNGVEFRFPTSTGVDNTIVELVFLDAASGGNIIGGGTVAVQKLITTGDRPVYEVGSVTITLN